MKLKLATVAGSLAAAALVSFAAPSYAALEACPASFTADGTAKVHDGGGAPILTAASMCQYVTPADNSNVASITNINAAGFFGFSDWQANSPVQGQIDANASTGTWSISNVNFALYDYIIVFKDGEETNLIAFLFNEAFSSGGWSTPFTEPPFDFSGGSTSHDVSHYTIARRLAGQTVSEPGVLALFGASLLMLGFMRRRKSA